MVNKGLKVGDVFKEGGLYYEVQSVLPNGNYISKRVNEPEESVEQEGEVAKEEETKIPTEGENTEEAEVPMPQEVTIEAGKKPVRKTGGKKK